MDTASSSPAVPPARTKGFASGVSSTLSVAPEPTNGSPPASERIVACPGTPGAARELFLTADLARWWEIARSCVRGEPVFHVRHPTKPVRFRLVPEWDESAEDLDDGPWGPPETTTLEEDVRASLASADAGRTMTVEEFRTELERRRPELERHREERQDRERRDRVRRDAEREDWEREARRQP